MGFRPRLPSLAGLRRSRTTVHIDAGSARVLVARGGRVVHWAIAPLEPGLVRDGAIVDAHAVARALATLLPAGRRGRRNLAVGLSGQQCLTRIVSLPQAKRRLLREAIPREIRRQAGAMYEGTHFAWEIIGREDGRLRVFALGAPADVIDAQVEAIRLAGGTPATLGAKPLALTRAVGQAEALIVDLEPDGVEVIVVRDRVPVAIRTGSLRPGIDSAEDQVLRVESELGRTLKYHAETYEGDPFATSTPAYLTGSLASTVAEARVVELTSGHPLQPLAPALRCPPDLPVASLMVNLGLAMKRR